MFGSPAASSIPCNAHLILLGPDGGADLHLPQSSYLAASVQSFHHESAFSWLSMSTDSASIHSSLIHCMILEAAHRAPHARSGTEPPLLLEFHHEQSDSLIAYCPFGFKSPSHGLIDAIETHLPSIAPGSIISRIPAHFSANLAAAISATAAPERPRLIEAACDALSLSCSTPSSSLHPPKIRL
jgi:hypothetical protein